MSPRKKPGTDLEQQKLPGEFPEPSRIKEPQLKRDRPALWTQNKAQLVQRYLHYFVFITKHGTYIDGFAGPQDPEFGDLCCAKLVIEDEPMWLRNFYLYETDAEKVEFLSGVKESQPEFDSKGNRLNRKIEIHHGDFNQLVPKLLSSEQIPQTEATFCLLDQRTFECDWKTVQRLAKYKTGDANKFELFYFLPDSWLPRAFSGIKDFEIVESWWGRKDYHDFFLKSSQQRRDAFVDRFSSELGYRYVVPWKIFQNRGGLGRVMYYMIHCSDHEQAPVLMQRAYHNAVCPEPAEQQLELFGENIEALTTESDSDQNDTSQGKPPESNVD